MRSLILSAAFSVLPIIAILFSPLAVTAAPGPDETAESATYDIELRSRSLGSYSGQATFEGDPDRPQDSESGALQVEFTLSDDASAVVSASGTWWSWNIAFFSIWFAAADTDTGGQIFSVGLTWSNRLFGRLYVVGDADLGDGRYRLHGEVAAEPETAPEPELEPAP